MRLREILTEKHNIQHLSNFAKIKLGKLKNLNFRKRTLGAPDGWVGWASDT